MKSQILLLLFCFGVSLFMSAQVTVDPPFPQEDDQITVFFDATQGTAGLKDCNCDIYLHSGVITSQSNNTSDWKNVPTQWGVANPNWQLLPVSGQDNIYSISYNIRDFYNLAAGEEVEALAFVFRNADGSLEGKGSGGADIFYELLPPNAAFELRLLAPAGNLVVRAGDPIRVYAATTSASQGIKLSLDGAQIGVTSRDLLDTTIIAIAGSHNVSLQAIQDGSSQSSEASFTYVSTADLPAVSLPTGIEPGYTLLDNGLAAYYFYAPLKERALLYRDFTSEEGWKEIIQMSPLENELGFYIELPALPDSSNFYQYVVEGSSPIADPFSKLVVDPNNDRFISDELFPDIPRWTGLNTPGIASWVRNEAPFDWQHDGYDRPEEKDLVIYELLIRDFTAQHSYQALIDSLDYFERLGINAIELMPVNEFENNESWGYNVSYHMALDKYYGRPEDFKAFVDACHERGIAVLVDVVFNHGFGQNPYAQLYASERAAEPDGAGPFFNVTARHPFNVGQDMNHESIHTKRYVGRILRYMIEEYHLDGFRFDLSKGFTQTNNPDNVGAWGQYDASRIAILKAYRDSIQAVDPASFIILEHFADGTEERELTQEGMFVWGNMNFNFAEAAMGYTGNDLYGVTPQSRGFSSPRLVGYMESHDEERITYKTRRFGNSDGEYTTKDYSQSLARNELISAFFYTSPGARMLWQFGEYGYAIPIDFNGRTGNKPIEWFLLERQSNQRLFDVTSSLIKLRRDYPTFVDGDHDLPGGLAQGQTKVMSIAHPQMDALVIGNFGVTPDNASATFPNAGTYYDYLRGDSIAVGANGSNTVDIPLNPGAYTIYTSVNLPEPDMGYLGEVSSLRPIPAGVEVSVFPNPSSNVLTVDAKHWKAKRFLIEVFSSSGNRLTEQKKENGRFTIDVSSFAIGVYVVKISDELQRTFVKTIEIQR